MCYLGFTFLGSAVVPLCVARFGIGGGDIKLMAAAGFLLGWRLNLAAFFTGLFSGGVYGSFLLLSGKGGRKDSMAFGPFLCLGIALAILLGEGF